MKKLNHAETIKSPAAALLGAAVLLAFALSAPAQTTEGPAFLKGNVRDLSERAGGLAEKFAAAKTEAVKSGAQGTFFAAARFQARDRIRYGRRGEIGGDYTISASETRLKIREKNRDSLIISDGGDEIRTAAPAVWILLCNASTGGPVDATVLDPERNYEVAGAPVVWLGDASGSESLALIEKLTLANPKAKTRESLVFILGRHAEPRVHDILQRLAVEDENTDVRRSAIFWLGNIGDARSLAGLKAIFREERNSDVKEHIVFALTLSKDKDAVIEMIRIAKEEDDHSVREKAVFWLGQKASAESVKALRDIVQEPTEEDRIKEQAVFAISQLPKDKAVPMLIDIAKANKSASVRKKAMFWLGQTGDPAALKFFEDILLKR
jgi:HEAT repeat protein